MSATLQDKQALDVLNAFLRAHEKADPAGIRATLAEDYAMRTKMGLLSRDAYVDFMRATFQAVPDGQIVAEIMRQEGATIHLIFGMRGTHTGTFQLSQPGFPALHATGKKVEIKPGHMIAVVKDGKIATLNTPPGEEGAAVAFLAQMGMPAAPAK